MSVSLLLIVGESADPWKLRDFTQAYQRINNQANNSLIIWWEKHFFTHFLYIQLFVVHLILFSNKNNMTKKKF